MTADGILTVNKAPGMTSHDVVQRLRRLTGQRRIGHTGTLDPMARGVLLILLGHATRITEYLDGDEKVYRCRLVLGRNTDTQDAWGQTTAVFPTDGVTAAAIEDAFSAFHGVIRQRPPMYSAVRVGGKHLYTYARAGETVEVPARTVYIRELAVEAVDLRAMSVTFRVACSKGTYIRTICQDVGAVLGTGAYLADLVRLQSGPFRLEDAVSLETLEAAKDAADAEPEERGLRWLTTYLQPLDMPLAQFGKALVPAEAARRFADGRRIPLSDCRIVRQPAFDAYPPGWPVREEYRRAFCLYCEGTDGGETFLGVAFCDPAGLYMAPDKVFVQRAAGGQA